MQSDFAIIRAHASGGAITRNAFAVAATEHSWLEPRALAAAKLSQYRDPIGELSIQVNGARQSSHRAA
jgi:hypothetical protein